MITKNMEEFCCFLKPGYPIMAIDYGAKKIGIAISSPSCTIAMPLKVIKEIKKDVQISEILSIINSYSICGIVIGLPVSMKGSSFNEQVLKVHKFAELLRCINLPIYFQDERLTSKTANNLLKSLNLKRQKRNEIDDAISASLILETALSIISKTMRL